MDKISEVDDIDETLEDIKPTDELLELPEMPDYTILHRNFEISQQREKDVQIKLKELENKLKSQSSGYELKLKNKNEQIEVLITEKEQLKGSNNDDISELKDAITQKDRKIRHLNTSVILLKNFLFFFKNKAIKGLKVANDEVKREIETVKDKYFKELEESKDQIIDQINKSSTAIPSEALQNTLKHTQQEFEKYRIESKNKLEKLQSQHKVEIEKIHKDFEFKKLELISKNDVEINSLKNEFKNTEEICLKEFLSKEEKLKEQIEQLNSQVEHERSILAKADGKIELLNTTVGRYQSTDEILHTTIEHKNKEISDLKSQINDLINSVKSIKDQSDDEIRSKLLSLESEVKEYKDKLSIQDEKHADNLSQLHKKHDDEIKALKDTQSSNSSLDAVQRENFNKLLQEKDELYKSTKDNFESILSNKNEKIQTLQSAFNAIKSSYDSKEEEIKDAREMQHKLVERIREEIQSVLSLKTAYSDEAKIASKEELTENVSIINDFFRNPYSQTLKKVFKLKRLRKDDSSVDSNDLLKKNHHDEHDEHEIQLQEENIEKLKEKHVNEGRIEDMAKPGNRNIPPMPRGRGAPPPRGRATAHRMPPRHNTRAGMQATQSSGSTGSRQNRQITIMDPTKNIKRANEESPVDILTGGITTPPSRKRSTGIRESPKSSTKSDPFKLTNIKQEQKKKQEMDSRAEEEYEEEEEEEDEGEETPYKSKDTIPVPNRRPAPLKSKNVPTPIKPGKLPPSSMNKNSPTMKTSKQARPTPPPPNISRIVSKQSEGGLENKRDPPPMKPRQDQNPPKNESIKTPFLAPPEQPKREKGVNEDRSKTPQPVKSEHQALKPAARSTRYSRETDEPPITHAVVRDKSIGERIRSSLWPGFLGGSTSSNLAVSKIEENVDKKAKPPKDPKLQDNNVSNKDTKNTKEESSAFGLFDKVLGLLGRRKTESKQAFMGKSGAGLIWDDKKKRYIIPGDEEESDEDDLPPPPKIIKKKLEEDKNGSDKPPSITAKAKKQNIVANRYASTFDSMQISSSPIDMPSQEMTPFRPPSFDADPFNQPANFDEPIPEKSSSPKTLNVSKDKINEESKFEDVRKEISDFSSFKEHHDISELTPNIIKSGNSYDEEVEYDIQDSDGQHPNNQESNDSQAEADASELNKNYEKAYNQLFVYRNENKQLKREIAKNQTTAELNIDYFVQLCEDVKYRGLEEIETYKNEIIILRNEQERFIENQAKHIYLIDNLEYEIRDLKTKADEPHFDKPYPSPTAASTGLKEGLDELKHLHMVLEKVHSDQLKIKQKDTEINNIIEELLSNIDENSEQGQILKRNLNGEYDIATIRSVIQSIFEESNKHINDSNNKIESSLSSQLARMSEDSKYKEDRINELIREGLTRASAEEEQAREFMLLSKQSEEKDERIQELEDEIDSMKRKHEKIEEQYQSKFREILDESQSERDEWMRSDTLTVEESSALQMQIKQLQEENFNLEHELEQSNESYRVMEAEFTKYDEDNNAMQHTIQILEKEVAHRNELLEQYEQGNDNIIEESQEKVKGLIDEKIEAEQKYDDLEAKFISLCDYLKDIHNTIKNDDYMSTDDDFDKSFDQPITMLTEEEMEEMYESILNLYENKKQLTQAQ